MYVRRGVIQQALLSDIVSGVLRPGQRLPTRLELQRRYAVSAATLQVGLEALIENGFIVPRGRLGTFVAEYPPHLYRVGLVFSHAPTDRGLWSRFCAGLVSSSESAVVVKSSPGLIFRCFFKTAFEQSSSNRQEFLDALSLRALAGAVFVDIPTTLLETEHWRTPMPKIVVSERQLPGCQTLYLDMKAWMERAVERLVQRGARRVAVISSLNSGHHEGTVRERLLRLFGDASIQTRTYWNLPVHASAPETVRYVAHLLMSGTTGDERPDGLIIMDDHLVEQTTLGLLAAGEKASDLRVVAHANFPAAPACHVPADLLGFDGREILIVASRNILDAARNGYLLASTVTIAPKFASEITTR